MVQYLFQTYGVRSEKKIIYRVAIAALQFCKCPHLAMIGTDSNWNDYLAHTIAYFDKMKSNFAEHSREEFEKLLRGR
jgi:hypothetical protein